MKKWARGLSLLLAAVMLFSVLAGCKKSDDNGEKGNGNNPNQPTERPEFTYTSDYSELKTEAKGANGFSYAAGRIYFQTYDWSYEDVVDEETGDVIREDRYIYKIMSMASDGTDIREVLTYEPSKQAEDGWEGSGDLSGFTALEDGVWLIESLYMYRYNFPEGVTRESLIEEYGEDGMWEHIWEYYEGRDEYNLVKLSASGEELVKISANELIDQGDGEMYDVYINGIQTDKAGNLYVFAGNKIVVLDKEGNKLFQINSENWFDNGIMLKDGSIAIVSGNWENDTYSVNLYKIDLEKKDFTDPIPFPISNYDNFYSGSGDYDLYYITSMNFMGLNLDTGESELLFNFVNCDVDASYMQSVVPLEDGSVLAFSSTYNSATESNDTDMYRIYKVRSDELPEKIYLTYACMGLDTSVRKEIVKFNRSSQKYRIEVVDYYQYMGDGEDAYTDALQKFATELIAGKVPDMFATDNMPISQLGAKGYLEDLWPYIENDFGRSGVVEPLFNALTTSDGKLYEISPRFTVQTVAGMTSVVGDKMGWTMDDLMRALKSLGPDATVFGEGYTRDDALRLMCSMMLDGFINWETGECTFDSPDFIELLEFANLFPEEFDWEAYWQEHQYDDYDFSYNAFLEGKQLLSYLYVSNFIDWRRTELQMGGDLTFVGYPVETGIGSAFSISAGIAMSSSCADKDGAWEFMRRFLTEDYQGSVNDPYGIYGIVRNTYSNFYGFPTNKAVYEQRLTEAMTPEYQKDDKGEYVLDENGNKIEIPKGYGYIMFDYDVYGVAEMGYDSANDGNIYHLTEDQAGKITDLIERTTRVYSYDAEIYDIIVDRASAFFAGQQSAEDAAKAIQSRIFLYVNEQR